MTSQPPLCILHHLGLGDQIMLNGMVRHFVTDAHRNVHIFVKDCHEESVRFMYRDIELTLILVSDTKPETTRSRIPEGSEVLNLATYGVPDNVWEFFTQHKNPGTMFTNWAHGVYIQAGLNPLIMYSKFKVVRDPDREDALFIKTGLPTTYTFVHDDDHERDRRIDIDGEVVFRPGARPIDDRQEFFSCDNPNIFDYLKIIENAEEVHCMNSSYSWMIDLMNIRTNKNTIC